MKKRAHLKHGFLYAEWKGNNYSELVKVARYAGTLIIEPWGKVLLRKEDNVDREINVGDILVNEQTGIHIYTKEDFDSYFTVKGDSR